uniref:Translocon Sec61/SecY plug domain-containing protein n=1 Tax=Oryza glumipatula TaxID=40148 RepID=A0A0E0BVI2_9ORYZ
MATAAGRYEDSGVSVSFRRKAAYTAASLLVFLVAGQLPLYGVKKYNGDKDVPDPLYWMNCMFASSNNTLMTLGIIPLLLSEMAVRIFSALIITRWPPFHHVRLNRARKLLAIAMAMVMAVSGVLSAGVAAELGTMASLVVMFQLFLGGMIAIYLDELLQKGYGLLSGVSLFAAANCCACIFWKAFTAEDPLLHWAAIIVFFKLVLQLQSCHITLPAVTSPDDPTLQTTYTISPSYMAYVPILFQPAFFSFPLVSISQTLSIKYGETNRVVNLLVKWQQMCNFGAIVTGDPGSLLYAVFLLTGCAFLSLFCFKVCAKSSKRYLVRLVGKPKQTRLSPDDEQLPDEDESISPKQCRRYMTIAAIFVGFCVGFLSLLAGFLGLDGPAIMLAVTVIHSVVQDHSESDGIRAKVYKHTRLVSSLFLSIIMFDHRSPMAGGEGFFVDVQVDAVRAVVMTPAAGGNALRLLVQEQEQRAGGRRRTDGGDSEEDDGGDCLRPYEPIIICCAALVYLALWLCGLLLFCRSVQFLI